MKKTLLLQILVMLIALTIASALAPILQKEQKKINPDRDLLAAGPFGGNQKVISDWEWMRFINYLGQLQVVDETNVKEVTERLERLVGLDPKYERLYLDGLSSIQHADPKKTVEILEKACKLDYLKNNWKIPFYTGFIYSRDTYDIHDQNGTPLLAADHAKAAEYFKMAIERCNDISINHVVNNYIRELSKAEAVGTAPDRIHAAKLRILYREWKKSQEAENSFSLRSKENVTFINDLPERLLKAIQEAKNPMDVYEQRFEPSQEVLDLIAAIRKDVLFNQNLCPECLYATNAGDRFCTHCGHKLEVVRGICKKCGATLKPDSNFCPECGTQKVNDPPVGQIAAPVPKNQKK